MKQITAVVCCSVDAIRTELANNFKMSFALRRDVALNVFAVFNLNDLESMLNKRDKSVDIAIFCGIDAWKKPEVQESFCKYRLWCVCVDPTFAVAQAFNFASNTSFEVKAPQGRGMEITNKALFLFSRMIGEIVPKDSVHKR